MIFFDPELKGSLGLPHSKHLLSCRVQKADIIKVTNLNGRINQVKITNFDKSKSEFIYQILTEITSPKPVDKVLFQAIISKNYLEKIAEIIPVIGVTKIYLFQAQFSPIQNISLNRLNAIMTRSCEQSENPFLPEIILVNKNEFLEKIKIYKPVLLHQDLKSNLNSNERLTNSALVGSEGGFSPQELQAFEDLNLIKKNLGNQVLPSWLAGYTYFSNIL